MMSSQKYNNNEPHL